MQPRLHIQGLDLLRKSIIISVVGSILVAIGSALAGFGMFVMSPQAALGAAMGMAYIVMILGTLVNLAAWYFQFNGWDRLCRTRVEGFFCTTYTAVKWGMLIGLILTLLGSIVMYTSLSAVTRPRPPRPGMPFGGYGAMGTMMLAGALSGLGGLINLIVVIIVLIAYFKVSDIYNAPNVKWGAILLVVGALLAFIGIGVIISIIGLILLYIGLGDAIRNVQRGLIGRPPPPPPPPPPV